MKRVLIAIVAASAVTATAGSAFAQANPLTASAKAQFDMIKANVLKTANKVGPELNGVVGRTAGTAADFKYSDAMIEAGKGGLVWTPDKLDAWLKKPKDVVAGTKMTFAGLADQADIDNVIAYLQTFPAN